MKKLLILILIILGCKKESMEALDWKLLFDSLSNTKITSQSTENNSNSDSTSDNSSQTENTPDTTPPGILDTNLQTSLLKATGFQVNWIKATDNKTTVQNLEYKLVYSTSNNISSITEAESSGSGRVNPMDWTKDTNSFLLTGLTVNTTYYISVIVRDEANNKSIYTTKDQITKNIYDNFNGTISNHTANKTYTKCSLGQVWVENSNDCNGVGDSANGYGFVSKQYCSVADHSCNSQAPTWQLNGSGNSQLYLACDELILADHTDWRVPNFDELKNFYDNALSPNRALFPRMVSAFYFSSSAKSEFLGDPVAKAIHMEFGTNTDLKVKTESSPVICVRDGL